LKKISFIEETIGRELSGNPRIEDKELWKAFDSWWKKKKKDLWKAFDSWWKKKKKDLWKAFDSW
jgi:hypothetical protein